MANLEKGIVEFSVGSGSYQLRLSTNAMCELETVVGRSTVEIVAEMFSDCKIGTVRAFMWAMLNDMGHEIDLRGAASIIDELGLSKAIELVSETAQAAFPASDQGGDQNPTKAE